MSDGLETTPWFTKNLAAGVDTSGLLGGRWDVCRWGPRTPAMVPHGRARGETETSAATAIRAPRIIAAMLLAIDVGNTNVTIGLLRSGRLVATRRAATNARATADELEVLLEGLLRLDD